jgi:hypothetical protein
MQYSGFLPMRSKSNTANSYGGPRLSRRGVRGVGVGGEVTGYISNRSS